MASNIVEPNNQEIKPNVVYSSRQTCARLGITRWALRDIIKRGDLTPVVMGNKYRFSGQSILNYLNGKSD